MTVERNPASAGTAELCLPPALRKPRLRSDEASAYLEMMHGIPIRPATLARMRWDGSGPTFTKSGSTPLYAIGALDAWAAQRLGAPRSSSSDGQVR